MNNIFCCGVNVNVNKAIFLLLNLTAAVFAESVLLSIKVFKVESRISNEQTYQIK
jgi:hypothetical protein